MDPTATTYTVHVQEFKEDRAVLFKNSYELQLAKSVSTDGGLPLFNVVFKSKALAPQMTISWDEQYGLNWVQDMDKPGVKVTFGGSWVAAQLGDAFDLDNTGGWVKNNTDPSKKDALNILTNNYAVPVHIIVGVKDAAKADPSNPAFDPNNPDGWTPIYVSPKQLLVAGSGHYTPKQGIQLWYESKDNTATMISDQYSWKEEFDMTKKPEWYFHWVNKTGKWQDQKTKFQEPPSPIYAMAVHSNGTSHVLTNGSAAEHTSKDILWNPRFVIRIVRFAPRIEKAVQAVLITKAIANLTKPFGGPPTVAFKNGDDGKSMEVKWTKKDSFADAENGEGLVAEGGDGDAQIEAVLNGLQQAGVLPSDQTWEVDDVQN